MLFRLFPSFLCVSIAGCISPVFAQELTEFKKFDALFPEVVKEMRLQTFNKIINAAIPSSLIDNFLIKKIEQANKLKESSYIYDDSTRPKIIDRVDGTAAIDSIILSDSLLKTNFIITYPIGKISKHNFTYYITKTATYSYEFYGNNYYLYAFDKNEKIVSINIISSDYLYFGGATVFSAVIDKDKIYCLKIKGDFGSEGDGVDSRPTMESSVCSFQTIVFSEDSAVREKNEKLSDFVNFYLDKQSNESLLVLLRNGESKILYGNSHQQFMELEILTSDIYVGNYSVRFKNEKTSYDLKFIKKEGYYQCTSKNSSTQRFVPLVMYFWSDPRYKNITKKFLEEGISFLTPQ